MGQGRRVGAFRCLPVDQMQEQEEQVPNRYPMA